MNPPSHCRIMMTTDAVGGVWTYTTDLARRLCAREHEVALVTLGPPPDREQLARLTDIEGLSIEVTGLALEWMDPEGTDTDAGDVLLTLADRICPDVVHLNSYREAALDWRAPVLLVAHSCVWSWWESCRGSLPEEPRWDHYRAAVAAGLSAAHAWVAPTSAFRADIERYYAPHTAGRVIRNGADVPICVSPKEPFILAAGRLWDEAKNLRALEAIAAGLDWPVHAAGPIREPASRGEPQACRGMEHLGTLSHDELIVQMRRASIFVSPALYEPFGLSVLEAAAGGCALVLSGIASFRELWAGAALFVDPSDCAALAETLQRLCRDEALRGRLQQAARRRSRRYRLDSMVLAYEQIYAQLMNCAESSRADPPPVALPECRA